MSIRTVVLSAVAVFAWEKEQAQATNAIRKENYATLFAQMREAAETCNESDIVNATHLLGVELRSKGWKDASIKVRRSEFRRIMENIAHVSEDCASWKKALQQIKQASMSESDILHEQLVAIDEQILALMQKKADIQTRIQELAETPASIQFSDEVEETRQMRAA